MNIEAMQAKALQLNREIGPRLAAIVAKKLGAACEFSHWIKRSTGDVPVFIVPDSVKAQAVELGLTVKAQS